MDFTESVQSVLNHNIGTALTVLIIVLICFIFTLRESLRTSILAVKDELTSIRKEWAVFNAASQQQAKNFQESVVVMRDEMTRLHKRVDRHDDVIDRLEGLHLREGA